MHQALALLLLRARQLDPSSVARVDHLDVVHLEAELGRPLPRMLKWLWQVHGQGAIGALDLLGPKQISSGLSISDRLLDEGMLPLGTGPGGDPWGLQLDENEDPDVVLVADFPRKLRAVLGHLGQAIEVSALGALLAADPGSKELARRIARLDPEGRFRDPASWASAPLARGA